MGEKKDVICRVYLHGTYHFIQDIKLSICNIIKSYVAPYILVAA